MVQGNDKIKELEKVKVESDKKFKELQENLQRLIHVEIKKNTNALKNVNFDFGIMGNTGAAGGSSSMSSDMQELVNRKVDKTDFLQLTHQVPRRKDFERALEQIQTLHKQLKNLGMILL